MLSAPIFDTYYSRSFGKRKTYLVIIKKNSYNHKKFNKIFKIIEKERKNYKIKIKLSLSN